MKKVMFACLLIVVVFSLKQPNPSMAIELTEITGWQCGEPVVLEFDSVSGNRGLFYQRDYVTATGTRLHAVWIEGSGEKGWEPPTGIISADDGLMGMGAIYKTMDIAGEKAIIEDHPVTGYSAAVKISGKGTLTVESKYATKDDFIEAVRKLAENLKQ